MPYFILQDSYNTNDVINSIKYTYTIDTIDTIDLIFMMS